MDSLIGAIVQRERGGRETDRQTDRDRGTDGHKQRQRETETERECGGGEVRACVRVRACVFVCVRARRCMRACMDARARAEYVATIPILETKYPFNKNNAICSEG